MLIWNFTRIWQRDATQKNFSQFLNIGSCVLHIVHGGLQEGTNESRWKLGHLMRSLWQLFNDTPARRKDFVILTVFPQMGRGCWCDREGSLNVVQHQEVCFVFPCNTQEGPQTASYATIKEACEDPLTVTQLEFFISVAKQLQPFLLKFQTDAPMAPFLGKLLKVVLLTLMSHFIKKDVLEQAN